MERRRVQKVFSDMPSKTQQNFRKECDINLIYSRYQQTGQLPEGRQSQPQYGEQVDDFQAVAFAMARARSTFEELPTNIQQKYGSVEGVMEAMQDPNGAPELHADGILTAFGVEVPEMQSGATEHPTGSHNRGNLDLPLPNTEQSEGGEAPSEAS